MEPTSPRGAAAGSPDPELKASDVREAAGLSYRQLNDWDTKGALSGQRVARAGWRKFSARDVFALMVCSEIRKRFGAPIDSLRFVRDFMLQDGPNHLEAAVKMMQLGLSVWLLTDLKETFVMDSDVEFEDMFKLGYFRTETESGYVFLRLNPLVNRLLGTLKTPIRLETRLSTYRAINEARRSLQIRDDREFKLLALVRDRDYSKVVVELKSGEVVALSAEREHAGADREITQDQLNDIIRSQAFQTVTLKKCDGKTVRLVQSVLFPLKSDDQTAKARRKDPGRPTRPIRRTNK